MKSKKIGKYIYILSILLLLAFFTIFILEKSQITNFYQKPFPAAQEDGELGGINEVDYSPADPTDNSTINEAKNDGSLVEQPSEPGAQIPINVILASSGQDVPGGPVVIRVLVNNTSGGVCDFTLSKESAVKEYTNSVVNAGNYYICEPLDIPANELASGVWSLNVTVINGDRIGEATGNVEVSI